MPLTLICEICNNGSVHCVDVGLDAEHGVVKLKLAHIFACHIKYFYLRHLKLSFPYAFTLSVIITIPPFGAGDGALNGDDVILNVNFTISRF